MQSNVSARQGPTIILSFSSFYGDKNKHGRSESIRSVSLTKDYTWSTGSDYLKISSGTKYFLRLQRSLSDYVPLLIDHDLSIYKDQFGC